MDTQQQHLQMLRLHLLDMSKLSQRAVDYATALMSTIRDPRLRRLFAKRPLLAALFDRTPVPSMPPLVGAP